MKKNTIMIFARAPVPGEVKTRLAMKIGAVAAAQFYRAMLGDTLNMATRAAQSAGNCEVILAFTPDDAFAPHEHSLSEIWDGERMAQRGDDLGARMLNAMNNARKCGTEHIVIIGSDAPDLPPDLLVQSLHDLAFCDVVFGPAHDGGFYLIGASRALPQAIFAGLAWSSAQTLNSTLANVRKLGLEFQLLTSWADIDSSKDLIALRERLDSGISKAPETAKFLREKSL